MIRVEGAAGNWLVWHAGQTVAARGGAAEITLPG
jgi:hypothetical protein